MGKKRRQFKTEAKRNSTRPGPSSSPDRSFLPLDPSVLIGGAVVAVAILVAYSSGLSGPFIFDDPYSIVENPSIRRLWAIGSVLTPPGGGNPVQNRPFVNLTFAINYALGGYQVFGYHLFNIGIHLVAALTLLGVVRRTLMLPAFAGRFGAGATLYATAVALWWGLHPLVTETVTYTTQRTESMYSMFYLLTLYCCIRGYGVGGAKGWFAAAVGFCLLGMGCKEPMATAPLMILLYDRVFVAHSWKEVFQRRWGLYVGLAAGWVFLGSLMLLGGSGRGASAGFRAGMTPWTYACTQFWAICHYLRLSFWPRGLVLDYGIWIASVPGEYVPQAILLVLLGIATLAAYLRWPWVGYLGTWFFVVLAPSSSIVPVATEPVAERRMYLPLAAVVALVVFAGSAAGRRLVDRMAWPDPVRRRRAAAMAVGVTACVAVALGTATFSRNRVYRSALEIWNDTIAKRPRNARAYLCRGHVYGSLQMRDKQIADYDRAIELNPYSEEVYNSRGDAFAAKGDSAQAMANYSKVIEGSPNYSQAYVLQAYINRANAYADNRDFDQAIADYSKAIEIKPGVAQFYVNRAIAYEDKGDAKRAMDDYSKAIELKPDFAEAYNNRGLLHSKAGAYDQAVDDFSRAIAFDPNLGAAYSNRAYGYYQMKNYEKAWADIRACDRLGAETWPNLRELLMQAQGAPRRP